MSTSQIIMVVAIMLVVVGIGVFIIINGSKPKKQANAEKGKFYAKLYQVLARNFLTQGQILKIHAQLSALSVYRKAELQQLTSRYFLVSTGVSVGLVVASLFLFDDFFSTMICIMFAFLLNNILVDKQIDKVYLQILKGLSRAIGSLRQEYMRLGDVIEAFNEVECDDLLKKPMNEIYTILTSNNSEIKLQEFFESTPFRTIQTLASISYNISNQGDTVDSTGQSNFVQALTLMSSDVNSEIQKILKQKKEFGFIEYLPFVPIFGMGLLEGYFMGIMPGTALIYNGPIGFFLRTLTMVVSIGCYVTISRINCTIPIKEDDRSAFANSMLLNRSWAKFINNIIPKGKKATLLKKKFKDSLSKMTIEEFYTKKVVFSAVTFVLSVLAAISTVTLGHDYILNSTQQLSLVATDEMNGYSKEVILNLDNRFMEERQYGEVPESEALLMVSGAMPGLTDLQKLDQVKRMNDKYNALQGAYFQWWMLWICALASVVGWFGPDIGLKMRRILVVTEAEDDFLQLQTLVTILMNTEMDTLDIIGQLAQNSRIHKDMLLYAYHGYPSNPEMEIERLKSKTPLLEFRRFLGKLRLTISDLSLREAFSDLIIEREHILRVREMTIESTIRRKRGMCGPLSMFPLGMMVVASLLIPLGYLGIKEFMSALTMM